jgi:hypothetical protein
MSRRHPGQEDALRHPVIPVERRAILMRINRRLRASGRVLHASRGSLVTKAVGEFYERQGGRVVATHVDPIALAREIGCVQAWEDLRL